MMDSIDFGKGEIFHRGVLPDIGIPFENQTQQLSQDMLQVWYQGGKYVIDVGCYDSKKLSVVVVVGGDVRRNPFREEVRSSEELKESIEKAVREVHKLLGQPDEVSPYTSILSPKHSTDPLDSLLGRVEVEWESKEFEVTAGMMEAVEKEWGVPLPTQLKKVALACNGGGSIPMVGPDYLFIQHLFSFHPQDPSNIHEQKAFFSAVLPEGVFPIGKGAIETVCLDYRDSTNEPKVLSYENEPKLQLLAHDFEEFLTKLKFDINWENTISETSPASLKLNLDQLETQWGIEFPWYYKKLILQSNGGEPDLRLFFYEKGREGVDHLLRVDTEAAESVYGVYKKHFDGTSCYPFAKCLSGSYLCHDYREGKPTVSLWDAQEGIFYPVKSSFPRFLHYLRYYPL